jgi:hypothetical protein
VWDAADNGGYSVFVNPSQVRDHAGNVARAVKIGWFTVNVPQYPTNVGLHMATKGIVGVDVTRFGAVPDDGLDDTDAIQRAIDSLPKNGDGVPTAQSVLGGTIVLPKGTFNTNRPLKLPPAARVRGQGALTVLANNSTDGERGAFELVSETAHGFNIRAGVEGMRITTVASKGIRATDLRGDLQSLRLADLTISAGGAAIDLRDVRAYATEIRNVTVADPGSTALWIGPPDDGWISNVNRVTGLHVTGTARAGFRGERAMVVLGGDVAVDGLRIDETGAPVTPLYATGAPTFTRTDIRAARALPDGVVARFENCFDVALDRLALAPGQRLDVRNVQLVSVGDLTLAGETLMDSVSLDGVSNLSVGVLRSSVDAGRLSDPRVTVAAQAAPLADAPRRASFAEVKRPASQTVRDVTHYGAIPDDGIDDTAAIQRAIDALPTGSGVPGVGKEYTGGLVLLPAGRFDTSAPLLVPSGVWLRGRGNATVIHNGSGDAGRGAVELVSRHDNRANVGAAVEDLSIYTVAGMGIRADGNVTGGLIDVRLSGLMIGAQSVAIDLGAVRTYHASIGNIIISNAGSSGLILGDAAGYSADNHVVGFHFLGGARGGFRADEALVVLRGETYFQNGWVEHPYVPALPLHVEGAAAIRGFWLEYAAEHLPDGVAVRLTNATRVHIDRLAHVSAAQRLELVNAKNVRVGVLNITGYTVTLPESVALEGDSNLAVGVVVALRDAGMFDHPRVRVESAYNHMDRALIHNRPPGGPNLLADPLFATIPGGGVGSGREGDGGDPAADWSIQWGDGLGAITGTAAVEQGPTGPRLRVTITSNPNNRYVTLRASLNVPSNLVGTNAVARWRIDGPALALMYNANYDNQYSARAMGSLTASRTPVALRATEDLVFTLPGVGTYYISNLSVTPM